MGGYTLTVFVKDKKTGEEKMIENRRFAMAGTGESYIERIEGDTVVAVDGYGTKHVLNTKDVEITETKSHRSRR